MKKIFSFIWFLFIPALAFSASAPVTYSFVYNDVFSNNSLQAVNFLDSVGNSVGTFYLESTPPPPTGGSQFTMFVVYDSGSGQDWRAYQCLGAPLTGVSDQFTVTSDGVNVSVYSNGELCMTQPSDGLNFKYSSVQLGVNIPANYFVSAPSCLSPSAVSSLYNAFLTGSGFGSGSGSGSSPIDVMFNGAPVGQVVNHSGSILFALSSVSVLFTSYHVIMRLL